MTTYRGGGMLFRMKKHLHKDRKKETLNHINRLQGQLNKLKSYVENDATCEEIASLTTSTAKSFDALRVRTLEGFLLNEIVNRKVNKKKVKQLRNLLKMHKK